MQAKRTLAERAKWNTQFGIARLRLCGVLVKVVRDKKGKALVLCLDLGIQETFDAPTLAAAKVRAIELVQERIRELCKEWEV